MEIKSFSKVKLTSQGLRLLAKAQAGVSIEFTRAIIGDGYLPDGMDPIDLTWLIHEVESRQEGTSGTCALVDLTKYDVNEDGTLTIRVKIRNGNTEFYLREIGIVVKDPTDNKEYLYAYTNSDSGAEGIPAFNPDEGSTYVIRNIDISFLILNMSDLNINITMPAEVSWEEFQKGLADKANIQKNPNDETSDHIPGSLVIGNPGDEEVQIGKGSLVTGGTFNQDYPNKCNADDAAIVGGFANSINVSNKQSFPVIVGGQNNHIKGSIFASGIFSAYGAYIGSESDTEKQITNSVIIGGVANTIYGSHSAIIGAYRGKAYDYNIIMGRKPKDPISGHQTGTEGDALILGIGAAYDEASGRNGFRVDYAGNGYFAVSVNATGADVAEMYEWQDGNVDNEDRAGRFVIVSGRKIRYANENDDISKQGVIRRIGAISKNPGIIADNYADEWCGKYLRDVYDRPLTEQKHYDAEYADVKILNKETGEYETTQVLVHPEYDADEYIINPEFNPDEEYIPRMKRAEYEAITRHGKITIYDGGKCEIDGYCRPGNDGVAIPAEDGFYVMDRVDENHIYVLI